MQIRLGRRRSLRRAVVAHCRLHCPDWDRLVPFRATELSNEGLWLPTPRALVPGEEVTLCLLPPGARSGQEIWATAEVVRVGRAGKPALRVTKQGVDATQSPAVPLGMALTLTYCSAAERRFLARCLQGHPPPLPARRSPPPLPARRSSPPPLPRYLTRPAVMPMPLLAAPEPRQLSLARR